MKRLLMLSSVAAVFLVVSCGDNPSDTTTDRDTANIAASNTQSTVHEDTTRQSTDLMKPMNEMMQRMQSMQMTGDFDVDFANMMVEHHQGAIDMAQIEVAQGKNEKIKAKAQDILTKQQKEQQELKDFAKTYKPSGMKHGEHELEKSTEKMMDKMKSMQMTGNLDNDFLMMMISHHQDGIEMSKMETKHGMSDKLKMMAKKGIADQQKDIKELQSMKSTAGK